MLRAYYRYGIARERGVLKRQKDAYHGLVFSAHVASYYRKSCAELVDSLRKPYIIDPFTFIFARDPGFVRRTERDSKKRIIKDRFGRKKKGAIKRSFAKLVDGTYGEVIERAAEDQKRVRAESFRDDGSTTEFVTSVLDFQDNVFDIASKYSKYAKYVDKSPLSAGSPEALVAPYFYVDPVNKDEWHALNVRLIRKARAYIDDSRDLHAVACINRSRIASLPKTIREYADEGVQRVWIWISDLRDIDASSSELVQLVDVVEEVADAQSGCEVGNLYAGALSVVLGSAKLAAVSCGPCYGEARSVDQDADDAVIPTRYYCRDVLRKIVASDIDSGDIEAHADLRCSCVVCNNRTDVNKMTEEACREHFLLVRNEEITEYATASLSDVAERMDEAVEKYSKLPAIKTDHLGKWATALRQGD